jgi:hypothetical protein
MYMHLSYITGAYSVDTFVIQYNLDKYKKDVNPIRRINVLFLQINISNYYNRIKSEETVIKSRFNTPLA